MTRNSLLIAVGGLAAQFLLPAARGGDGPANTSDGLMEKADSLRAGKSYLSAADLYLQVARGSPGTSQASRAALRAGNCFESSGKWSQAMEAYDAAISSGGMDFAATAALYRKAAICSTQGCPDRALDAIRLLKAQAPDTGHALQAKILEDDLQHRDATANRQLYVREQEASRLFDSGIATHRQDPAAGLQLLDAVVREYPDTPAALRAMETKAHLLSKSGRRDESTTVFESIVTQVGASAPHSRIVLTAKTRLAVLYNSAGRKADALKVCEEVMQAGDSPLAAQAGVTAAAAKFELLQEEPGGPEKWDEVRAACKAARNSRFATPAQRMRVGTMAIETLCWQGRSAEAVTEAKAFLQDPEAQKQPLDIATVLFFAGEELQKLGRYDEALKYYRRVVQMCSKQKEIWPGMDHVPRTYYRIWETLRLAKAPAADIRAAANDLLNSFPDSAYASRVRLVTNLEGR